MLSRAHAFATTSDVFALAQPFQMPAPIMRAGMSMGPHLGSSEWCFIDPQQFKQMGYTHSSIIMIYGEKGTGKSTLLKDMLLKSLALQAGRHPNGRDIQTVRALINDRKPNKEETRPNGEESPQALRGEFAPAVDFALGEIVSLADVGRINPFDVVYDADQVELSSISVDICETIEGRALHGFEVLALQLAVYRSLRQGAPKLTAESMASLLATPTQQDVAQYYAHLGSFPGVDSSDLLQRLIITRDTSVFSDFCNASMRMSACMTQLVKGPYGKIFGGTTNLHDTLTEQIVSLDWTDVTGRPSELLESLIYRAQTNALRKQLPFNPDLLVSDEEGTKIKNLVHARNFARYVREARAYRTVTVQATQFSTDHNNLGDDGSELRQLGREIDNGIGVRIYGRQPAKDEILHSITLQGASDEEAWNTTQLPRHCWGIKLPDQPMRYFQHVISHQLKDAVDTERANTEASARQRVSDMPHIKKRQRELLWPNIHERLGHDIEPVEY